MYKVFLPHWSVSVSVEIQFGPIGNFRTYLLGGIKYDIDLSSNSTACNAEDMVKLKQEILDWKQESDLIFLPAL